MTLVVAGWCTDLHQGEAQYIGRSEALDAQNDRRGNQICKEIRKATQEGSKAHEEIKTAKKAKSESKV